MINIVNTLHQDRRQLIVCEKSYSYRKYRRLTRKNYILRITSSETAPAIPSAYTNTRVWGKEKTSAILNFLLCAVKGETF